MGATTSRVHTAVKIAPPLRRPGGLCARCLTQPWAWLGACCLRRCAPRCQPTSDELSGRLRQGAPAACQQEAVTPLVGLERRYAPTRTPMMAGRGYTPPVSAEVHRQARICVRNYPTWPNWPNTSTGAPSSRPGTWPGLSLQILERQSGRRNRRCKVYADAQRMLKQLVDGRWLKARGVFGLLPGQHGVRRRHRNLHRRQPQPRGDDAGTPLRQQTEEQVVDGVRRPNRCLADFIAPRRARRSSGLHRPGSRSRPASAVKDKKAHLKRFLNSPRRLLRHHAQGAGRPPGRSLCRIRLHQRVRTDLWGYAPDEIHAGRGTTLIAEKLPAESAPHPATLPAPTTASSATCSACWAPSRSA